MQAEEMLKSVQSRLAAMTIYDVRHERAERRYNRIGFKYRNGQGGTRTRFEARRAP